MSAWNIDPETVRGFGREWTHFDQSELSADELQAHFDRYFNVFDWARLPSEAIGFDLGCGSGRWARLVAPKVARLYCFDPSEDAIKVARRNLGGLQNCIVTVAGLDEFPVDDASMDFGYSIGVLHHVPDPAKGIARCSQKLKPGAPLLLYLYYRFDNRPSWFVALWRVSDLVRRGVSRLPHRHKVVVTGIVATFVYWPLARLARLVDRFGLDVDALPLSIYRNRSFYSMRTDALDRLGTRLEHRFTRPEITQMMIDAGLTDVVFSENAPYWCVVGYRRD